MSDTFDRRPDRLARSRQLWAWIAILLIDGLAAWMRVHCVSDFGLSFDESFTLKMVQFSWPEMLDRIRLETQPPLYYALLKLWQSMFGTSIICARSFTTGWGVLAVHFMYLFVRDAYCDRGRAPVHKCPSTTWAALLAAALLSIAPLHVFWTSQIRMYSLPLALCLMSSWLLVRALDTQSPRVGRWVCYLITAIALSYSHYVAIFVVAAQLVYALGSCLIRKDFDRPRTTAAVFGTGAALALFWLPWLPSFLAQRSQISGTFYLPRPTVPVLANVSSELWTGTWWHPPEFLGPVLAELTFITLVLLLLGKNRADWLIVLAATTPTVAILVLSTGSTSLIAARYLLFGHAFVLAAGAVILCRTTVVWRSLGTVIALGTMLILGMGQYRWTEAGARLRGIRGAVRHFESSSSSDELLIVSNPMYYTSALAYSSEPARLRTIGGPDQYPYFQGTQVLRDTEYFSMAELEQYPPQFLWTLDSDATRRKVPLPAHWGLMSEQIYDEWFGKLILRLYRKHHSSH